VIKSKSTGQHETRKQKTGGAQKDERKEGKHGVRVGHPETAGNCSAQCLHGTTQAGAAAAPSKVWENWGGGGYEGAPLDLDPGGSPWLSAQPPPPRTPAACSAGAALYVYFGFPAVGNERLLLGGRLGCWAARGAGAGAHA
jgi:hypothetical protein